MLNKLITQKKVINHPNLPNDKADILQSRAKIGLASYFICDFFQFSFQILPALFFLAHFAL